jgi:hypothetical protein
MRNSLNSWRVEQEIKVKASFASSEIRVRGKRSGHVNISAHDTLTNVALHTGNDANIN